MRYSVSSRFQAVLVGATLGEEVGSYCHHRSLQSTPPGHPHSLNLSNWRPAFSRSSALSPGATLIVQMGQNLIRSGGAAKLAQLKVEASSTGDWLLAALPIALFYHDDEIKLHQALAQTVSPKSLDLVVTVSSAIAQSLREQLHYRELIPHTIAVLLQAAEDTPALRDLLRLLEQVQGGLQQNAGLSTIVAALKFSPSPTRRAVAMALYCFLSTPEDLRLSVLRAAQVTNLAPLTAALTGAMAGAHNSTIGIPIAWSQATAVDSLETKESLQMNQLAGRLWAVWAGVLDPAAAVLGSEAIAAPNVIRSL